MFWQARYSVPMSDAPLDQIGETPILALRYKGRKRVRRVDGIMARIAAERLMCHLEAVGRPAGSVYDGVLPPGHRKDRRAEHPGWRVVGTLRQHRAKPPGPERSISKPEYPSPSR